MNDLDLDRHRFQDSGANNHQLKPQKDQVEIVLAESALTLSELEKLLDSEFESSSNELNSTTPDGSPKPNSQAASSIRSLRAIQPHVQNIVSARQKVEEQMTKILYDGLVQLDRSMLSSSFQTAYNLSILDQSIGSLMHELTELISKRIKVTFDINSLAREAGPSESTTTSSFGYKSRARTEPTPATLPQWTSVLWNKLEGLIDDLTTCCIKVYTLEKVLEWKKDPATGVPFLEVVTSAGSMLEERPSTVFWTTLSNALGKETRETLRASNFIAQTLSANYPHLLRLFHDFFSRISLHTHTIYNSSTQSPETILTLRAVLPLETIYLNKSMNKMNEASNGSADKLTAVLVNELDAARFDPLLVRSVARKVKEVVENYLKRMESRIIVDYQSTSLAGPTATPAQIANIQIYNNLLQLSIILSQLIQEYPDDIKTILEAPIELTNKIRDAIMNPVLVSIKREMNMVMAKMHNHPHNHSRGNPPSGGGGGGLYMHELRSKLSLVRNEILGRLNNKEVVESIFIKLTKEFLRTFLFHASLMNPLTESLKLRLTADLAEFEFEISQFLLINHQPSTTIPHPPPLEQQDRETNNGDDDDDNDNDEGRSYVTDQLNNLKIFRQLIFSDQVTEVQNLIDQSTLERLIVLHHLIVKHQSEEAETASSATITDHDRFGSEKAIRLKLVHQIHGWNEAEYLRWVEEHSHHRSHRSSFQSSEPIKVLKKYFDDQLSRNHFDLSQPQDRVDELLKEADRFGKWLGLIFKLLNQA